jgi:hypothetical protein
MVFRFVQPELLFWGVYKERFFRLQGGKRPARLQKDRNEFPGKP